MLAKKPFSMLILMMLIGTSIQAQSTGYVETFDDNLLTGWDAPNPGTFALTETSGVLKIDYHRTVDSWEWDNFNYTPPQNIDILQNPFLSIKARSTIQTGMAFKVIYGDDRNDWLEAALPGDNAWHEFSLRMTVTGSTVVKRIYFYLDGGTTAAKSGVVQFDDLKIGRPVGSSKAADLETAIAVASNLIEHSREGVGEGEYPFGSKSIIQSAIDGAAVLLTTAATEAQLDSAVWAVYDACVTFESGIKVFNPGLNDSLATGATKHLYYNLDRLSGEGLIFGMHDATGYGVGWSGDDDRSDVRDVCGDYPGLYSWDMNTLDKNNPPDVASFTYRIRSAHARGGINTLSWHQLDPRYGFFYADSISHRGWYNAVASLLPGGEYHEFYRHRLRIMAGFLKGLRDDQGRSIPIIFRPYHEQLGTWFWWGAGRCSTSEYNQIWRFTVTFLRDSLNVHNLIYAISPSDFATRDDYLRIYPGDDYIDILGMDFYFVNPSSPGQFLTRTRMVAQLGLDRSKVAAVTEVGEENLPTINWFTGYLLPPLKNDSLSSRLVYAAVWRNASISHHFAPFPGDATVPDFIKFYQDPWTLFEADLPDMFAPAAADTSPPRFLSRPEENLTATETRFEIEVVTDERASLRYSFLDQPFNAMPYEFARGQGAQEHATEMTGEQGVSRTCYIRALDIAGNESPSVCFTFTVDTLMRRIEWHDGLFQDSDWPSGRAPLGFNSSDVLTNVRAGRTIYFRKIFSLDPLPATLGFLIKCHDGAVVYLNGTEIGRVNMPAGIDVGFETAASSAIKSNSMIVFNQGMLSLLRRGENLLAVEVHTVASTTVDLSFDGRLFNQSQFFVDLGSAWNYNDDGAEPLAQRLGDILAGVRSEPSVPATFRLYQNRPNPFNPETTIRYEVPAESVVSLQVYDLAGRLIRTLAVGRKAAGVHEVSFEGSNLASGLYFCRLQVGSEIAVKRMLLLK